MIPKSPKHAPTKGREKTEPAILDGPARTVPLAKAKANTGRSAANNDCKPASNINPNPLFQDNDGDGDNDNNNDDSKRKARLHNIHPGSEPMPKRIKKQYPPASNDTKDNPLNDDDRKPEAKKTAPIPDGAPSSCSGLARKRTSTHTRTCTRPKSVVSTSGQRIKRERERKPVVKVETGQETTIENAASDIEPVVYSSASAQEIKREQPVLKTETIPAPSSPSPSEEEIKREPSASEEESKLEASIPTEAMIASNVPNLNRTFTMRQKVAKRIDGLNFAPPPPPQNIAAPLSPSPQAEEIAARKKPRHEEPLLALRRSSRLSIDTPVPVPAPPTDTMVASPLRRSSRRVVPTSSTGTSAPPPTATVVVPTLRRSRPQTKLPRTEMSEEQLDDEDYANCNDGNLLGSSWEDRLSDLADYHKIHGHCNVPWKYSENIKLGFWVGTQRRQYNLHRKGKQSSMTPSRIQEFEIMGFEWDMLGAVWEDRLSELADYRKIHGHCNVPRNHRGNSKLGNWVHNQRTQYRLHLEGKKSSMTTSRIEALENLAFEWDMLGAVWEDRLSELADYRKIHGHCNVPRNHRENSKLGYWVHNQRKQYRLHLEGKISSMTTSRIQELESMGFEWDSLG